MLYSTPLSLPCEFAFSWILPIICQIQPLTAAAQWGTACVIHPFSVLVRPAQLSLHPRWYFSWGLLHCCYSPTRVFILPLCRGHRLDWGALLALIFTILLFSFSWLSKNVLRFLINTMNLLQIVSATWQRLKNMVLCSSISISYHIRLIENEELLGPSLTRQYGVWSPLAELLWWDSTEFEFDTLSGYLLLSSYMYNLLYF